MDSFLSDQDQVIRECVRVLRPTGSVCWQVGNHVSDGEVFPLDCELYHIFRRYKLQLRNRIVWHFGTRLALPTKVIWSVRNHKLVDKERQLHFQFRPDSRPSEISRQALFQGTPCRSAFLQPAWKEPKRRMGNSKRETQSRREDRAPVPIPR